MQRLSKMRERVYFVPGVLVSIIIQITPSFYLRARILNWIGRNCSIHPSVTLHNRLRILIPRNIQIGAGSTVNGRCLLDSRYPLKIGRRVMVGHGTTIFTLGHDIDDPIFAPKGAPVTIEDYAIIFPKVLVMPGVTIGSGAVVLPGSVVTADVAPMAVVGGAPARYMRERKTIADHDFNYRCFFAL